MDVRGGVVVATISNNQKQRIEVTPTRIIMKKQSCIPALLNIFLKLKVSELILVLKDVQWAYLEWSTLGGWSEENCD